MTLARIAALNLLATLAAGGAAAQEVAAPTAEAPDRAELEARFARELSGATLVGHFTLDGSPDEAPQAERYRLGKVAKLDGDRWSFEAEIAYGEKSFTLPLVLEVLWAGDTPVITLTERVIPLVGTFTARVLIYGDRYAGIWDGGDHGGQMFGRVERAADVPAAGSEAGEQGPDEGAGQDGGGDTGGGSTGGDGGNGVDGGSAAVADDDVHWPSFRGPRASGHAEGWETALEWDVESGENVAWRVPVAGLAHSAPVIWGDRLFLTTAVRAEGEAELKVGLYGSIEPVKDEGAHAFRVLCLDKETGEELWSRTAWEGVPAFPRHPKGSFAASTPATDGERVVAFFGSEGLYCYDVRGELLWQRDFGPLSSGFYLVPDAQWGFSSSPVLHDGRVIVQCDILGDSFVAALDAQSGEQLWATPRDDVPTWSTPTVDVRAGRSQVVCNGFKHIGGYDLETGAELWKLVGGGDIPVPTPVVAHDLIFITNAHGTLAPIYAVEAGAEGELAMEHEHMAWAQSRRGNYMQTPLVYGEELYCCNDGGVLTCYDARTGAEHYQQRLGSGRTGFTASAVAADGKLYLTSEEGEVFVVRAGTTFEQLAVNPLGEECMSTPAISAGTLFWRTRAHVVAVAGS